MRKLKMELSMKHRPTGMFVDPMAGPSQIETVREVLAKRKFDGDIDHISMALSVFPFYMEVDEDEDPWEEWVRAGRAVKRELSGFVDKRDVYMVKPDCNQYLVMDEDADEEDEERAERWVKDWNRKLWNDGEEH